MLFLRKIHLFGNRDAVNRKSEFSKGKQGSKRRIRLLRVYEWTMEFAGKNTVKKRYGVMEAEKMS